MHSPTHTHKHNVKNGLKLRRQKQNKCYNFGGSGGDVNWWWVELVGVVNLEASYDSLMFSSPVLVSLKDSKDDRVGLMHFDLDVSTGGS